MWKERLRQIVERQDTFAGRAFDLTIQALILVSLITFSLETLPDLPLSTRRVLRWIETVTVLIFTAEYLLRLFVAQPKRDYAFSFYGLIDLAAILPFYISTGVDLRAIRAFRLLRLARLLKLFRYGRAIERYRRAFRDIREELILFLAACLVLVFVSAVGIYYFENPVQPDAFSSVFDSMWWAVATLTTVGYGDVYPVTAGGRVFTTLILVIGLGVVAVPAGLIASSLSEVAREEQE
jgi:voltage-gated potassium channel